MAKVRVIAQDVKAKTTIGYRHVLAGKTIACPPDKRGGVTAVVATRSGRDPRVNVTSPLVVKLLATGAFRLGIDFFNLAPGVRILVAGQGDRRAVSGSRAVRPKTQVPDNPLG